MLVLTISRTLWLSFSDFLSGAGRCSSSKRRSSPGGASANSAELRKFHSDWRKSFKILNEIYAESPDVAYAQKNYMLNELDKMKHFIRANLTEEERIAKAAEQQAQREGVISWVQEQQKFNAN